MEFPETARLYIISTPIGNLEDITLRSLRILREVDALACEDTRTTKRLLQHLEIPVPDILFSYHEHNEEKAARRILELLQEGRQVGLVSDAGTPAISDPGFRILSLAAEEDLPLEVVPGPGAVQTALVLSGLPTSSFTFKGFPPRKDGQRRRFLEPEANLPHTLVFFESKFRVVSFLESALAVLGDRQTAVCVELTKKFERVYRGYISDLIKRLDGKNIKGEVTIVIAGNHPKFSREDAADPTDSTPE